MPDLFVGPGGGYPATTITNVTVNIVISHKTLDVSSVDLPVGLFALVEVRFHYDGPVAVCFDSEQQKFTLLLTQPEKENI